MRFWISFFCCRLFLHSFFLSRYFYFSLSFPISLALVFWVSLFLFLFLFLFPFRRVLSVIHLFSIHPFLLLFRYPSLHSPLVVKKELSIVSKNKSDAMNSEMFQLYSLYVTFWAFEIHIGIWWALSNLYEWT